MPSDATVASNALRGIFFMWSPFLAARKPLGNLPNLRAPMFRSCFRDEKSPYICAPLDPQMMRQTLEKPVTAVRGAVATALRDEVAIERALQIRTRARSPEGAETETALATTMRTPGEDDALAAGFLYAEGIVRDRGDLVSLAQRDDDTIVVELSADAAAAAAATTKDRRFVVTGACGVCGRADLERAGHHAHRAAVRSPARRRRHHPRSAGRAAPGAGDVRAHGRAARRRPVRARTARCARRTRTSAGTTPSTSWWGRCSSPARSRRATAC